MVDRTPLASPYPWAPEEKQISRIAYRKRKGSGMAFLCETVRSTTHTSDAARRVLHGLLGESVLKESNPTSESAMEKLSTPSLFASSRATVKRRAVDPSMDEDTMLGLAQDGKLSLFQSIVQVVQSSPSPVSTKAILRQCCLSISPGTVPATMDAKEMVLSALYFLSAGGETSHANDNDDSSKKSLWKLPVIRCVAYDDDLEKRTYEQVKDSSSSPDDLHWLEVIFEKSARSWQLLAREHMVPLGMEGKDETQLLLKGTVPASAKPKKQTGGGMKRKPKTPPPVSQAAAKVEVPVAVLSTEVAGTAVAGLGDMMPPSSSLASNN